MVLNLCIENDMFHTLLTVNGKLFIRVTFMYFLDWKFEFFKGFLLF